MPLIRPRFSVGPHLLGRYGSLSRPLARLLDRALALDDLNALYGRIPQGLAPPDFARCVLDLLGVGVAIATGDLERIPARGACLVVANHPHGAIDGLAMLETLMRRRGDLRIMANHLLGHITELRDVFIGVDPLGGAGAARINRRAVREALNWLRRGGLLMLFPGGEVSSLDAGRRAIVDPRWDAGVGWLARKSAAPVVPLYIDGRNSLLFQLAGLIHPRLRTALLVREMFNHRGAVVGVRCGRPVAADTLAVLGGRRKIAAFLEASTYLQKARDGHHRPKRVLRVATRRRSSEPLADPIEHARLVAEIASLPSAQRLVGHAGLEAWYARAEQIPWLLQEIGRLRELSFREVGEGSGHSVDLDLYDDYYLHLFVWDRAQSAIVGGYRLGEASRIVAHYGAKGLYVRSLFHFDRTLDNDLGAALEVGRSFVRPEHQRNYASLMLLWKGIGAFVARHPHFRILFGPVSISNDYHPVSQQLMVRFLQQTSMDPQRASLIKPHHPFATRDARQAIDLDVGDLRIMAALLGQIEDAAVGIPVLLRQYLKLNGRILGFNIDPEFSNTLDCLLWVDLARTPHAHLQKYMGRTGAERFLRHHSLTPGDEAHQQRALP